VRLGIGAASVEDSKQVWRISAQHYSLVRGTATRLWLDFAFQQLFGLEARLTAANADEYCDSISEKLKTPAFRPRSIEQNSRNFSIRR